MPETKDEAKKGKVDMLAPVGSKAQLDMMLTSKRDAIVALVGEARVKRFVSIMLAQTNRHPDLLECTKDSVVNAIQHCALIGLMPGPRGDIYLVPFKNKKLKGRKEISVIHGYKGLMKLAKQHTDVANVEAECVYEGDEFDYNAGEKKIRHWYPPDADHDPEKIIGAWSQVWFKDNPRPSVLYYNKEELDTLRKRSQQPNGNFWRDNPKAMYRKTVIRGHYNGGEIPMTDELSAAMDRELEEEFKEADVVSVRTERGGVDAAKDVLGLGGKTAIDEDLDQDGADRTPDDDDTDEPVAPRDRIEKTPDEDEDHMIGQIHERLQQLHGDDYDDVLAALLKDRMADNLGQLNFRELVKLRDLVTKELSMKEAGD